MPSINALEIPEIAEIIAEYLTDFEACIVVCKSWWSFYLPYHWREVEAGFPRDERKGRTPFFDPIRHVHYRKFIRVLSVYYEFGAIDHSLDYPNLRQLRVHYRLGGFPQGSDGKVTVLQDFVNRHPLLECLELQDMPLIVTDPVWTALLDHPRLEKVIMKCSNPVLGDFWTVCTRLRTLEFTCTLQRRMPKNLMLPSIRRLKLAQLHSMEFKDQLDIIAACPLLEDLEWMKYSFRHPVWARFRQLATRGTWPHLQRLSTDSDIYDLDLSRIITSMHQATKIEIHSGSLEPLSFEALQCHANTLHYLRIPIATDSQVTRDILCTFTRLEYLKAPRLNAKDIVEGGPWACTSLKTMSVEISFNSEDDDLQPVVFERMSRLVHLEEFDNRFHRMSAVKPVHGLRFRLQSGMAVLASLSQLRCISLDPKIQAMDLDDVRWIIDNWKGLKTIRGPLSQDKPMALQLEALISTSKIELQANS